jgi:hypothetical protein
MAIVDADQELEVTSAPTRKPGAPIRFGRAEYYVSILGKPSTTEPWMMQFGGHHLAINVTLAGSANVLAPTHTGAQPASYSVGGKLIRPLGDENDRAFELVNALTDEQKKQAILSYEVRNLVPAPAPTASQSRPKARAPRPNRPARDAARARPRMGRHPRGSAANFAMKEIESGLNETFRMGRPTTNGRAHISVQGRPFFSSTPRKAQENNVDHIHTIYREPATTTPRRRRGGEGAPLLSCPAGHAWRGVRPPARRVSEATRVSIARDRVRSRRPTPGVIAPAIIETLDANADNIFVPSEGRRLRPCGIVGRRGDSGMVIPW